MKRLMILAVLVIAQSVFAVQYTTERRTAKYGVAFTTYIGLNHEGVLVEDVDLTAATEAMISLDGGVMSELTTHPAEIDTTAGEGGIYSLALSAAEMTAAQVVVRLRDTGHSIDDTVIYIDTYGNPAALHAFDLDTAGLTQLTSANFAAGAITASALAADAATEIAAATLYPYSCGTEDVARSSTTSIIYYSGGAENAFVVAGAVLAVKNSVGFYEKVIVGSIDNNGDSITLSLPMYGTPANGEAYYLIETHLSAFWTNLTTENSFGRMINKMYQKVMTLR
jgi:hypothetical protein